MKKINCWYAGRVVAKGGVLGHLFQPQDENEDGLVFGRLKNAYYSIGAEVILIGKDERYNFEIGDSNNRAVKEKIIEWELESEKAKSEVTRRRIEETLKRNNPIKGMTLEEIKGWATTWRRKQLVKEYIYKLMGL